MTLTAKNMCVEYSGHTLLHHVDFHADAGQLIGVLGPSGSGKSTLLFALSGFKKMQGGKVWLKGEELHTHFESLKHTIGFVPQDDIVPLSLKVDRVLGYAADLRLPNASPKERKACVEDVLHTLELKEQRSLRVSTLSGGQRKRVSVGVELLSNPHILFADEPTSGLDPALERTTMERFGALAHEHNRIVVVTTHIMTSLDLLDRICVLYEGRLVFFGPPEELKPFFEVDDFIHMYATLQKRKAETWEKKFRTSLLRATYLSHHT